MYRLCRTEQSSSRQRMLEDGLLRMMTIKHYDDISVSELCDFLEIPRKTFYRYFSHKDGALTALIDLKMEEFFESERGEAAGQLRWFFKFWEENKILLDALEQSGMFGLLIQRAREFTIREGVFPQRLKFSDPDGNALAATFVVSGLMSMTYYWYKQGFSISVDEMATLSRQILSKPLITL